MRQAPKSVENGNRIGKAIRKRSRQSNAHSTGHNLRHTDANVAVDQAPTLYPERRIAPSSCTHSRMNLYVCTLLWRPDSILYIRDCSSKSYFRNGDHGLESYDDSLCATTTTRYLVYGYTTSNNILGIRRAPKNVIQAQLGMLAHAILFGIHLPPSRLDSQSTSKYSLNA